MTVFLYCWRCRAVVPMLDEGEWASVAPFLQPGGVTGPRGVEVVKAAHAQARERFRTLTGAEADTHALWHHRRSLFGPPCARCGKPLRTPRAKHCAECGADRHRR